MDAKAFFYDLGKAIYHIDSVYAAFARECNVAPALLWVLYALNDGKIHTQREICQDWALPKSTVNTVMTELKQKGLVELAPIKGKRREMTVLLTDSGKQYADSILGGLYRKEAEAFRQLTDRDQQVIPCLEKITASLKSTT